MNRMSSLPIAQYCGQGPQLGQIAAGRVAFQSTVFHAVCANAANKQDLLRLLNDDEIADVMSWHRPATICLDGGAILKYDDATVEDEVGLDADGNYCAPADPKCISTGHPDMWWCLTIGGRKTVFVGDIKRSSWTVLDGPDSLQLIAYAIALASKLDADGFVCGIWAAIEGEWTWGEYVDLSSRQAVTHMRRVLAAAQNASKEYYTGAHCSGCYGRMRCPAYLLPPDMAHTSIEALVPGAELTPDTALTLLLLCARAEETVDIAKDALKEYVRRGGKIVDPESGKRWGEVKCTGRAGLDKEAMERDGVLVKYKTLGKPYTQVRWLKGEKK